MNDPCLVCGQVYEREAGYFLGAMYFSYALAILILVPLYFLFGWLLPDWSGALVSFLALLVYIPLTPLVLRYSRAVWIYFDRYASPTEASAHEGWNRWRRRHGNDPSP
jgi:hypothetical protein